MSKIMANRIKIMNTEIDNLTMREAIREMDRMIKDGGTHYVVTPNVDHIVRLEKDIGLQKAYSEADLILTDGKPLLWISRLYGNPIKEKVSGSDLFPLLCRLAAHRGYKMFFLGAAEGVADLAAENLRRKNKGLKICGTYSPPQGFENDRVQCDQIIERIKETNPDILIVALGCPKQEYFIHKYRKRLNVPLSLGLGASLDFEAGTVTRAPKWMQLHGLEWLYRILQEPRRMLKRYLVNDISIFPLVLKYSR